MTALDRWLLNPTVARPTPKPVIQDEQSHTIEYRIIANDEQPESMKLLSNTKQLFQKQLPKMPGEYIARLVYDKKHAAMVILQPPLDVLAGIMYRVFKDQYFCEIVFCAVHSHVQVRVGELLGGERCRGTEDG
jgi:histone acetyltransferase